MKSWIKERVPVSVWEGLRQSKHSALRFSRRVAESCGYLISQRKDFYSPLPSEAALQRTSRRWNKPSALPGLRYDVEELRSALTGMAEKYLPEFRALPSYEELAGKGFGPGYPVVDAFLLYGMIRSLKPARYIEVGSGLSTCYCQLAAARNSSDGSQTGMTCIEPYPYAALRSLPSIKLIQSEVQDIPLETFKSLESGDVLFIDSSHMLKIDSDVAFIYLEVLPILAAGVYIHIHDVPFPFNVPYPPRYWTLLEDAGSPHWPMFWNEAMLVQAFLAFNHHFDIKQSCPLIRHQDESFIPNLLPFAAPVSQQPNTYSSLWLQKVK